MKKLFALLAVAALTAVGCDDKKSTPKPADKTATPSHMSTPDTGFKPTPATAPSTSLSTPATTSSSSKGDTPPVKKPGDGPGPLPDGKDKPKGGDK